MLSGGWYARFDLGGESMEGKKDAFIVSRKPKEKKKSQDKVDGVSQIDLEVSLWSSQMCSWLL